MPNICPYLLIGSVSGCWSWSFTDVLIGAHVLDDFTSIESTENTNLSPFNTQMKDSANITMKAAKSLSFPFLTNQSLLLKEGRLHLTYSSRWTSQRIFQIHRSGEYNWNLPFQYYSTYSHWG